MWVPKELKVKGMCHYVSVLSATPNFFYYFFNIKPNMADQTSGKGYNLYSHNR